MTGGSMRWLRRILGTDDLSVRLHTMSLRLTTATNHINRLEDLMATATEQLITLTGKFDDFASDVRAALAVINDDQLSPQAQAALDGLSAKLTALDTEVGDADGSDTPVVTEPAPDESTQQL